MFEQPHRLSNRALEMIMRDVLDGMQELAQESGLRSGATGCRILAIEPQPRGAAHRQAAYGPAQVVELRRYRKAVG
jgi:hypothetical protein